MVSSFAAHRAARFKDECNRGRALQHSMIDCHALPVAQAVLTLL
jgi:hypothetical protein